LPVRDPSAGLRGERHIAATAFAITPRLIHWPSPRTGPDSHSLLDRAGFRPSAGRAAAGSSAHHYQDGGGPVSPTRDRDRDGVYINMLARVELRWPVYNAGTAAAGAPHRPYRGPGCRPPPAVFLFLRLLRLDAGTVCVAAAGSARQNKSALLFRASHRSLLPSGLIWAGLTTSHHDRIFGWRPAAAPRRLFGHLRPPTVTLILVSCRWLRCRGRPAGGSDRDASMPSSLSDWLAFAATLVPPSTGLGWR